MANETLEQKVLIVDNALSYNEEKSDYNGDRPLNQNKPYVGCPWIGKGIVYQLGNELHLRFSYSDLAILQDKSSGRLGLLKKSHLEINKGDVPDFDKKYGTYSGHLELDGELDILVFGTENDVEVETTIGVRELKERDSSSQSYMNNQIKDGLWTSPQHHTISPNDDAKILGGFQYIILPVEGKRVMYRFGSSEKYGWTDRTLEFDKILKEKYGIDIN